MGLDLSCGGHLTHGSKVNFSGKIYSCESYVYMYVCMFDARGPMKCSDSLSTAHSPRLYECQLCEAYVFNGHPHDVACGTRTRM